MPSVLDTRRPALVTADFHARLASELGPVGFVARKRALVRRRGTTADRVELTSSHRNAPGEATLWIAFVVTDTNIQRIEPTWRAGSSRSTWSAMERGSP